MRVGAERAVGLGSELFFCGFLRAAIICLNNLWVVLSLRKQISTVVEELRPFRLLAGRVPRFAASRFYPELVESCFLGKTMQS